MRVDEDTIELAGSPAFVRRAPADGPPPLYLHGIPTSGADWMGLLARTGGIAPDLPGFGATGKGGQLDLSLNGHADFVEDLLAELEVDRVRLVMHGWGAGGGLVFAQRHPERVERLVLINALPLTGGFHWRGLARVCRMPLLGELLMGTVNQRLLGRLLRTGSTGPGAWSPERVSELWSEFDQGTQRAILRLHRAADEAELERAGEGLGALRMPALVLWGARDPWLPPVHGEAYAQRLPAAELVSVEDAGHWPWLDRPELVERIAGFVSP